MRCKEIRTIGSYAHRHTVSVLNVANGYFLIEFANLFCLQCTGTVRVSTFAFQFVQNTVARCNTPSTKFKIERAALLTRYTSIAEVRDGQQRVTSDTA